MLVLITDDNATNLKLLRIALESDGNEVVTASNAEETFLALQARRPDLIFMDIQLPGMDGLEITRRLKQDERTRDILVVAVTAYAMKGDKEKALAAGCDGYITKPIDVLALPEIIAGLRERPARAGALGR